MTAMSARRATTVNAAACVAALLSATTAHAAPGPAADTIFAHGHVITMEGPRAQAQAVAVRGGRILAVGSDVQVMRRRGPRTTVVDLHGRTLLPGFIDAHGHISGVAAAADMAELSPPPVGGITDIASLQTALRRQAANHPQGWILGEGYDDSLIAERRHPTRQELDAVSTERPVVIVHASGHFAALNTRALETMGLLHPGPDHTDGVVRREADGVTASGVVEESMLRFVMERLPKRSLDDRVKELAAAQRTYASYGQTTAQDGAAGPDDVEMWKEAVRRGALFIDVDVLPVLAPPWPERDALPFGAPYDRHLRYAGVKVFLDGSPQGRTAWLTQPVPVPPPGRDKSYRGYPQMTDAALRALLTKARDHGWQLFAHVNGDAAIQQLIDGVRAVDAAGGAPMVRTIAIHAQTARTDQLAQMKAVDIQPTFFASHTFYWGDWHRDVALGPERAARISPQREAIDAGLRPSIHNDSPVVPPDVMRLVWSAVNRTTRSGRVLGAFERVTPYEALAEVTINAAWQLHEDADKGSIKPGKLADLVILDADPLTIAPGRLDKIRVLQTIKEGRTIFAAPAAAPTSRPAG